MRKLLKLVFINVGVAAALITFANLGAAVVLWAQGRAIRQVDDSASFFDRPSHESREKAVRIYREFHALDTEYRAFVAWRRTPFSGELTTVDDRGRRSHPPDAHDVSPKTVAFFGGSTMWGSGADDRGTIPAHVDYASPALRTINLGESGWTSRQSLDMLINLIDQDEPMEVAVFYDGVNDVAVGCRAAQEVVTHGQEPVIRNAMRAEKLDGAVFAKVFDPTLTLLAKVMSKLQVGSLSEIPYACASDPARAEAVAETLLRNWEHARAIAERRGIALFAVLQPVSYVGQARVDYLDLSEKLDAEYEAVYARVREKIAERGHDWVTDFTDLFDGTDALYVDYCHVSTRGNALVARRMLEGFLSPTGESPVEETPAP